MARSRLAGPRERPVTPVSVRFRAVLSAAADSGPCDPELAILMRLSQHNLRVCSVYDLSLIHISEPTRPEPI
eukprot:8464350-Pyramimonas_sp.AAC.1